MIYSMYLHVTCFNSTVWVDLILYMTKSRK